MSKHALITVNSIEQWKSELPLSNLSESTRSLYIMLKTLDGLSLSAGERYHLLTALRPLVTTLTTNLSHYYDTNDALTENQHLIYDLTYGIYRKMFEGFKRVFDETQHSVLHPILFLHSIENAMHYCTSMLFHAYKYHQQSTPGLWLEFHHLYLICAKKHLHHFPLQKVDAWAYQMNNIENVYKHALLFIISNPYRLRHEQIDDLITSLQVWVPLLGFNHSNVPSPLYYVDCDADQPPRYASTAPENKEHIYFLHLEKVNEHLLKLITFRKQEHSQKQAKSFVESELKLPFSFINNLLATWQQASERVAARHKTEKELTVTPTLASVHWLISEDHPEKEVDVAKRYVFYTAHVVDESETGYCLAWSGSPPHSLQSGEILGIQHTDPSGNKTWEITVIRWIKQDPDGQVTIGLQKLSQQALPITSKPKDLKMTQAIATLLLPKQENKPITLITPLLPFKAGQQVEIYHDGKTYLAELKYTQEQTAGYQEFELDFIDEPLLFPEKDHG